MQKSSRLKRRELFFYINFTQQKQPIRKCEKSQFNVHLVFVINANIVNLMLLSKL